MKKFWNLKKKKNSSYSLNIYIYIICYGLILISVISKSIVYDLSDFQVLLNEMLSQNV